jgi:hypothetical protein
MYEFGAPPGAASGAAAARARSSTSAMPTAPAAGAVRAPCWPQRGHRSSGEALAWLPPAGGDGAEDDEDADDDEEEAMMPPPPLLARRRRRRAAAAAAASGGGGTADLPTQAPRSMRDQIRENKSPTGRLPSHVCNERADPSPAGLRSNTLDARR